MTAISTTRAPALLALAVAAALAGAACLPFSAHAAPQAAPAAATSESKAQQLNRLYAEYWEETLKLNPIQATFQGDSRYNDQLPNFLTAESRKEAHDFNVRWMERIERANLAMAFVAMSLFATLASPLGDPVRLAVANQNWRMAHGHGLSESA